MDSSNKNLGDTKKGYYIGDNMYAKEIWNAAIEKAAELADDGDCDIVASQIRKLKK